MDFLWSPWRFRYLTQAPETECVFCHKAADQRDEENLVLHRGQLCYLLLNIYPYTSGHMMVAPYEHVGNLAGIVPGALAEMMEMARRAEHALQQVYNPDGMNVGMNLGKAAGAGIDGHVHLHIVARWFADSNFMTVVGETRVIPEELTITYQKLRPFFQT